MIICKHACVSDFSTGPMLSRDEPTVHIYCHDCGTHWYQGKEYSKKEWEVWVNDFTEVSRNG